MVGSSAQAIRSILPFVVSSSSVETNSSGGESASRTYYAYGSTRSSSSILQTDRTYTGQKQDGTGLHYYNARYYDSSLGVFLSPDTLVPDPNAVIDYNRFLYVRGNPLKYNDPSGHCAILDDGSPDREGDGDCWDAADEWYTTFGGGDYSQEEWLKYFAGSMHITEDVLRAGLYQYWSPQYKQWRIYHRRYNPPPQWHSAPPPPDAVEMLQAMYLGPLLLCAKAVTGSCGIEFSVGLAGQGFGGEGSFDFYVDYQSGIGLYRTIGFGPALTTGPAAFSRSTGMLIVPGATADNMAGFGTELEASASWGRGVGIDLAGSIDLAGDTTITISPQSVSGFGAEVHWYVTHSKPLFLSRR